MTEHACPTELDLDRAFSTADPDIAAHVAGCAACSAQWDATADALALARDLPVDLPSAAHREDLRTLVLAASAPAPGRARGRWWLAPVLAIAAAAAVLIVLRRSPAPAPPVVATAPAPANHGTVHAHAGATYTLASDTPDEIVRLSDGTIDVDVRPLEHGQRFRIVIGADEVEVRGTSFEVVAAADHLVAVHVVHGRVEVRHLGVAPVVLAPGESWNATETAAVSPPVPSPAPSPPRQPDVQVPPPPPIRIVAKPSPPEPAPAAVPPPVVAPRAPNPQETAFVGGWAAMRQNDFHTAAAAFAKVVALDPSNALAEDGAFWHAVSLARLLRSAEATAALREFIEAYPSSVRAGEASAMLGWLLVEVSELDEAGRRFNAAVTDPSAAVQKSAREGLDALARRSK